MLYVYDTSINFCPRCPSSVHQLIYHKGVNEGSFLDAVKTVKPLGEVDPLWAADAPENDIHSGSVTPHFLTSHFLQQHQLQFLN